MSEVVAVVVPAVNTTGIEAVVAYRHNFAAGERFNVAAAYCTGRVFALVVVVRHFSFPPNIDIAREYIKTTAKPYIVVSHNRLITLPRAVAGPASSLTAGNKG